MPYEGMSNHFKIVLSVNFNMVSGRANEIALTGPHTLRLHDVFRCDTVELIEYQTFSGSIRVLGV